MPIERGSLRPTSFEYSVEGRIRRDLETDMPDDVIRVDLRSDEYSLNWMQYGPDDSDERFTEWSDARLDRENARLKKDLLFDD